MGCQRPLVTSILIACWVAVLIGTLITHAALRVLLPAVQDLPANLEKGFDEVFKFAELEASAMGVTKAASDAVAQCNQDAASICPSEPKADCVQALTQQPCYPGEKASTEHKDKIQSHFTASLQVIQRVANDKYLGSGPLKTTAYQLNNITSEMDKINSSATPCNYNVEVYCSIYNAAVPMQANVANVTAEIAKMRDNEAVQTFEDYSGALTGLHVLPWLFILALSFYCCFWYRGNGACCCCKEGKLGVCATATLILPHILLCLVFFVVVCVFIGIWFMWDQFILTMNVEALDSKPTVEEVLDHIQVAFPAFWNTVFADLESGLKSFLGGLFVLFLSTVVTVVYEICVCVCRPYRQMEDKTQG